jgi:hypothetical protein
MFIIPALRRLRQENCELKANLGYIALSQNTKQIKNMWWSCSSVREHLCSVHEALGSTPALHKTKTIIHAHTTWWFLLCVFVCPSFLENSCFPCSPIFHSLLLMIVEELSCAVEWALLSAVECSSGGVFVVGDSGYVGKDFSIPSHPDCSYPVNHMLDFIPVLFSIYRFRARMCCYFPLPIGLLPSLYWAMVCSGCLVLSTFYLSSEVFLDILVGDWHCFLLSRFLIDLVFFLIDLVF